MKIPGHCNSFLQKVASHDHGQPNISKRFYNLHLEVITTPNKCVELCHLEQNLHKILKSSSYVG